ncbi:MAG TPA: ATP-dependent zinc metalloprotease FtsH [Balneolales bacterium]|nr:ATP-dependent zinc metalloprotease FtsH [Balneolales bacterium]
MKGNKGPRFPIWIYVVLLLILLAIQFYFISPGNPNRIEYSQFLNDVKKGYVEHVVIKNSQYIEGTFTKEAVQKGEVKVPKSDNTIWQMDNSSSNRNFTTTMIKGDDIRPILDKHNVSYDAKVEDNWFGGLMTWILPIILIVAFWIFIFKRMNPGQQVLNIGKNRAMLYDKQTESKVTFKDVAGLEEAKEEVEEVVEFLKNPKKFTRLGGAIPKGVILVGPPGTGKTLLAKATAGEADVPFFSLSGSDFVEMFVGVGAARVRDLFKQAKEKAPCIIFIDEIDAIGRSRGRGQMMGSNDERENTLNQLLAEMDGFNTEKGVIIMAATNRPDVLDSALMRPGRFDRQILIDKPDLNGRIEVLEVHTKKLKLSNDVDLRLLASQTPGFAGAELANLANEAALLAARRNKDKVQMIDFQDAIERVIAGLEKKNKLISADERKIVAYHESGHAIVSWFLEHTDPVLKVSIVPRGLAALGYTLQTPLEDRFLMTREELNDKIAALLGGRVAEEIIFGKISTGAQNDLERVTSMAFSMVAVYGMSEELGYVSYQDSKNPEGSFGFNKRYSERTAQRIDDAVRTIIDNSHKRTRDMLIKHRENLEKMAQTLLEKEVLGAHDLLELLGERPHGNYPISLEDARELSNLKNGTSQKDGKQVEEEEPQDEEVLNQQNPDGENQVDSSAKTSKKKGLISKPEANKEEKNDTEEQDDTDSVRSTREE